MTALDRVGLRSLLLLAGVVAVAAVLVASCGGAATADGGQSSAGAEPVELVVSAAADLSPVLAELTPLFEEDSGLL